MTRAFDVHMNSRVLALLGGFGVWSCLACGTADNSIRSVRVASVTSTRERPPLRRELPFSDDPESQAVQSTTGRIYVSSASSVAVVDSGRERWRIQVGRHPRRFDTWSPAAKVACWCSGETTKDGA